MNRTSKIPTPPNRRHRVPHSCARPQSSPDGSRCHWMDLHSKSRGLSAKDRLARPSRILAVSLALGAVALGALLAGYQIACWLHPLPAPPSTQALPISASALAAPDTPAPLAPYALPAPQRLTGGDR